MTDRNHLVEEHIHVYECRLKHLDEVAEHEHLEEPKLDERLRLVSAEEWNHKALISAGPMGVWNALAQQLEKLTEKLEK